MSPASRAPAAPPRSSEQRLHALVKANEVRLGRAQLKRDLAAGAVKLSQVLVEPPPCAQRAKLREVLLALPGIGPARVQRALTHCRIAEAKTIAGLSSRQRTELLQVFDPPRG